jgi:signal transduction histidine kinase/Tfp pilus assembly protein PilF
MKVAACPSNFILSLVLLIVFFSCQQSTNKSKEIKTIVEIDGVLHNTFVPGIISLSSSFEAAEKALKIALSAGNDTMIVKSWLALGSNLRLQGKNDDARTMFQDALKLSKKINYKSGECQSLIETGTIFYIRGEYEQSGHFFKEALTIAQQKQFSDLEAIALNYIGKYYHTTGNFEESVLYYKHAIGIYKSRGNMLQSASVLLSLGKTYNNDGDLYMALRCYLDAYDACEKTNDYINLADVCNHLGTIYLALGQPDRSMEYHRKALAYRVSLNTPEGMANSFNNIGKVFLVYNNPDSARFYFLKALRNCEQISYTKGKVKALTNLGKAYNLQLGYSKAKEYLLQSLGIALKAGYDAGIAESSLELGNTFLGLNQPDSARLSYELCLKKAKSANLTELNHDGNWGLYKCCLANKDYEKSLQFYTLFAQAEKKLIQAENNHTLSELRITFESEKKEKDNEVLRKDNELKKMTILRKDALMWMILIALAFTAVFTSLLYSRFESKRKANKRLEQLNNQVTKQNRELEKLNKELENANREKDKIFSIITHELRNPLYWFQNLTEMLSLRYTKMPPEKVQKTLGALDESAKNAFHLMDNLLHWSRSRLNRITPVITDHSLEKLIHESSRMYETILRQKNIQLIIDLPIDSFIKADGDLFMCVVRNLVSNAIKYTPEHGIIKINSTLNKQNYIISVSDSGIGIDHKLKKSIFHSDKESSSTGLMNEKGSGFGLKLCKEFVEMNKGKIWVEDNNIGRTCFCFTVPYISINAVEYDAILRNQANQVLN